jgi:hypothetical protein
MPAVVTEQKRPLEDQVAGYDKKKPSGPAAIKDPEAGSSDHCRANPGLIPLGSALPVPEGEFKWVTAILGLMVLIIETVQQINQDQQNWIAYRSTCEALKHEKYLYLAGAGPYTNAENAQKRLALLADRIEGLISQEHAKWVSAQEQALATDKTAR